MSWPTAEDDDRDREGDRLTELRPFTQQTTWDRTNPAQMTADRKPLMTYSRDDQVPAHDADVRHRVRADRPAKHKVFFNRFRLQELSIMIADADGERAAAGPARHARIFAVVFTRWEVGRLHQRDGGSLRYLPNPSGRQRRGETHRRPGLRRPRCAFTRRAHARLHLGAGRAQPISGSWILPPRNTPT